MLCESMGFLWIFDIVDLHKNCEPTVILSFCCRVLKGGVFKGRGELGKPKDSGRKDWGNLRNIREDSGNHHPPLRILLPSLKLT